MLHPYRILLFFILCCAFIYSSAQNNTIKVQRNPSGNIDSINCGGVWIRSHVKLELTAYQPIHHPAEAFYVPKNYSVNDFIMQNGFGAHIVLSGHYMQLNLSRSFSMGLVFITGFDHFIGLKADSSETISTSPQSYQYHFNLVPLRLRMWIPIINGPKFTMTLEPDGGENILFTKFEWPPHNFNSTKVVPSFGFGTGFYFSIRNFSMGFIFKTENINGSWFREMDLHFPLYYGKYHR